MQQWITNSAAIGVLTGALLSITHPNLYDAGINCLSKLGQDERLRSAVSKWPFLANAITVISNRQSPLHRDGASSRASWYDILLSVGGDASTYLDLWSLGVRCKYDSGSCALFSGRIIIHGVSESQNDRVCVAMYMKDNLHERAGVEAPGFVKISDLM